MIENSLPTQVPAGDGWPLREHHALTQLLDQFLSKLLPTFFSILPPWREVQRGRPHRETSFSFIDLLPASRLPPDRNACLPPDECVVRRMRSTTSESPGTPPWGSRGCRGGAGGSGRQAGPRVQPREGPRGRPEPSPGDYTPWLSDPQDPALATAWGGALPLCGEKGYTQAGDCPPEDAVQVCTGLPGRTPFSDLVFSLAERVVPSIALFFWVDRRSQTHLKVFGKTSLMMRVKVNAVNQQMLLCCVVSPCLPDDAPHCLRGPCVCNLCGVRWSEIQFRSL